MDFAPAYFPSFPVPTENETIYSLFTRCKARSGFSDALIIRELTGQKFSRTLLGPLPAYLPLISGKLHDNHPGKDPFYLIRNHSMFPYFSYFLPPSTRQEFEVKLATSHLTQLIGLGLGLAKYPMKIASPPRFCISCLKEAIEQKGFPFYRVEHQLPGVLICHKHTETLYNGCKRCGTYPIPSASLSMAGHCKCNYGIEPLPVTTINDNVVQPLLWLAEQSAYMLGRAGTNVTNPALSIQRHALSQVTGKRKVIDYEDIARKIVDFFGIESLRLLNIEVFSGNAPAPWIRNFFYVKGRSKPTILYLLLIGAYFQSIDEFEQNALNENADIFTSNSKGRCTQTILQKHKKILENFVAANPNIGRTDVQKLLPGTYDFLIKHQKQYFQSVVSRRKATPYYNNSRKNWTSLDMVKANEVKSIFNTEYAKDAKPTYITRTSALTACNIFNQYRTNPDRFTEVSKVLSANLESRDSYRKRRLRWAIIQMTADHIPISLNNLRRTADLSIEVVTSYRDLIVSIIDEVGGIAADRSLFA